MKILAFLLGLWAVGTAGNIQIDPDKLDLALKVADTLAAIAHPDNDGFDAFSTDLGKLVGALSSDVPN